MVLGGSLSPVDETLPVGGDSYNWASGSEPT